jgi:hypothetical protein
MRYESVENSDYWLPKCVDQFKLTLENQATYISLNKGLLKIDPQNLPLDSCSIFQIIHAALPNNTPQSSTLEVRVRKDDHTPIIKTCTVLEGMCSPDQKEFPLTIHAAETIRVTLFKGTSLSEYQENCAGSLFYLSEHPNFISIDPSYQLVVKAPNLVTKIGTYHFYVNDWVVSVTVIAPCASNNFQGMEKGTLAL